MQDPHSTPIEARAPENLVFGLHAVRMGFLGREDLVSALDAWVLEKGRSLADVLVERGVVTDGQRRLLASLVAEHFRVHGGDAERSLAAMSEAAALRGESSSLQDAELQATLSRLFDGDTDAPAGRPCESEAALARDRRYTLLRRHAKGGLGEVFVARDEELGRDVALKAIQPRFADDPIGRSRFLREAEVTGGLEHPGIVPVYGMGRHKDGRPFYAMRLIKGESLKDAIADFHGRRFVRRRQRNLELRRLLSRFLDVCNAVEYAHSRGVLHRDLKPSNIMLGKHGETLVVDWGLAKVMNQEDEAAASDESMLSVASSGSSETLPGSAVGTPAYMSPEQAAGRLEDLGPRSDVYSLGATLYVMLTGKLPFDGSVEDVLADVRLGRFAPPSKVDSSVPLALNAVCCKAMATDPARRYVSCAALAADVEAWLADETVAAYREGALERGRRFFRRHRVLAATLPILLLTGVAASTAASVLVWKEKGLTQAALNDAILSEQKARNQARRAEFGEREATLAKDQARQAAETAKREAETAKEMSAFLIGLFQSTDPIALSGNLFEVESSLGPTSTVLELLRHGARQIRGQFASRPELKAALLADLGMALTTNACWDEAESLLLEALELRRTLYGAKHQSVGESLHDLGYFYYMVGDYDRAVRTSRESLDMLRELLGDEHLTVARSKFLLAWCLYEGFGRSRARDLEAERLLREALATREALLDANSRMIPFTKFTLTVVLLRLGKTAEAVRIAAEAAKQFEETADDKRPGRLLTLFQQAEVAKRLANRKNAVRLFQQALEVSQQMFGDNHPTVNYLRERVAAALEAIGDFEASEAVYKEALTKTLALSAGRPTSTYRLQEYALFLDRRGRLEESKAVLEEVLSVRRRHLGEDSTVVATTWGLLAENALRRGDPDLGRECLARALQGFGAMDFELYGAFGLDFVPRYAAICRERGFDDLLDETRKFFARLYVETSDAGALSELQSSGPATNPQAFQTFLDGMRAGNVHRSRSTGGDETGDFDRRIDDVVAAATPSR